MTNLIQKRISVLTGASTGIGKAIALKLENLENHLIILGRNKSKLEETLAEVITLGGSGEVILTDLSEVDSINSAIEEIK